MRQEAGITDDGKKQTGGNGECGDGAEVLQGEACRGVRVGHGDVRRRVFPAVDEEAVEAAEQSEEDGGGEQARSQCGARATVGMKTAAEKKMPTASSLGRRWALPVA